MRFPDAAPLVASHWGAERARYLSGARLSANSVSMNLRHAAAVALASAYLSGCLPVPWVYHTRPDVDGEVMQNHAPVGAARVRYSLNNSDENCDSYDSYKVEAVSSPDGKFHFEGTRSFFHIVFLLPGVAEFGSGRICFETSDGQRRNREVFLDGGTMVGSFPEESWDLITVRCDIASKETCRGQMR